MNELQNDIPLPDVETKKEKPTRARRTATKAKNEKPNPAAELILALKFVSAAQKKVGPVQSQFCQIAHNWAFASDGILTVGHPVKEDLNAAPNTLQLIEALSKAKNELSITQLSQHCLAICSGPIRALVPCVDFAEFAGVTGPDQQIAPIDDRVKKALETVQGLATEGAPNATYASVLLQANTAVATNGSALLEAWHGVDLPPDLMMPKCAAAAVVKSPYALTGFGYSQSSVTFWFENGSFIKTQLYSERYPHYQAILTCEYEKCYSLPEDFFTAVKTVDLFSKDGHIFIENGLVSSASFKEEASTYKIEGLFENMAFSAKLLLSVEHAMKKAYFNSNENKVFFFGDNSRGVVMALDLRETPKLEHDEFAQFDDQIPF